MSRSIKTTVNPFEVNRQVLGSGLSLATKAVMLVILDHARYGRSICTASTKTIAREAGITSRQARRVIGILHDQGMIRLERETGSVYSRHTIHVGPGCGVMEWPSYGTYLESDWWKERRAKTLRADHYRCRLCNSPDGLNVHHRSYERLGAERDDDLITLCRGCHAKFHDKLQ